MDLNRRKIRLELERLGWSQSRLAKEMGVKRQRVHQILNNDEKSHLDTIQKVALALGVDPKELLI